MSKPSHVGYDGEQVHPKRDRLWHHGVLVFRESDLPCSSRLQPCQYAVPVRMVLEHRANELCACESRSTLIPDMREGFYLVAVNPDMSKSCYTITTLPI